VTGAGVLVNSSRLFRSLGVAEAQAASSSDPAIINMYL